MSNPNTARTALEAFAIAPRTCNVRPQCSALTMYVITRADLPSLCVSSCGNHITAALDIASQASPPSPTVTVHVSPM